MVSHHQCARGNSFKHDRHLCQSLCSCVPLWRTALRFAVIGVHSVRNEVQQWGVVWTSALAPFTSTAPSRLVAPSTLITISLPAKTMLTCTRRMIRLKGVLSCLLQLYTCTTRVTFPSLVACISYRWSDSAGSKSILARQYTWGAHFSACSAQQCVSTCAKLPIGSPQERVMRHIYVGICCTCHSPKPICNHFSLTASAHAQGTFLSLLSKHHITVMMPGIA